MTQQEFFNRYSYNVRTDKVGGGSFGTVYRAYDNVLDRTVAIKVSEVKILGGKEFSLLDEFDAIKDLPLHPNIANYEALYNFDQANGIFDYAVLQYYPDGNLKDLIKKSELTQEEKEIAALQILAGLEFLHNHRVVHRDMKPSNILIQARNQGDNVVFVPKITDFGLSKKADPSAKSRFTNSFGGGTLEYSSPEQLKGQNLRFNTDLWAWAIIVYELFTSAPMFVSNGGGSSSAESEKMIFDQILNSELSERLSAFSGNWPQALLACLDRNPETRVKTAEDIRSILKGEGLKAPLVAAAPIVEERASQTHFEMPAGNESTFIDSVRQPDAAQPAQSAQAKAAAPKPMLSNSEKSKSKTPMFIGIGVGALALFFLLKPGKEAGNTLAVVQEDELFGYKNADSNWIITPKYLSAEPFVEGKAKVRKGDSLFIIDERGKMVEFISVATIDPVEEPIDPVISGNEPTADDDQWKKDFDKKYQELLKSENKRSDDQNLKEYQKLFKTIPSTASVERSKVNARIKYFSSRTQPIPELEPINTKLYGLKDIFNEDYDYVGEVKDGKPHGRGVATFKSGLKYVGDYKNGFREGQGTVTFKDGSKYAGGFKADKKHGNGTYNWSDGSKYTGDYFDNLMQGKGTYAYPNGDKYIGDWVKDYMQGNGIFYYKTGARYDGQFKSDKKHGWGKYYNKEGVLEYEGRYENDVRLF